MTALSCGILVISPHQELLLGHASGGSYWDIPKGLNEPGETAIQTAIRETDEETGLSFDPVRLRELGEFAYRPGKRLHLFAARSEKVDLGRLKCRAVFTDRAGRMRPEMDAFMWAPFADVQLHCAKSMAAVLSGPVNLHQVYEQLMSTPGTAP